MYASQVLLYQRVENGPTITIYFKKKLKSTPFSLNAGSYVTVT